MAQKAARWSAVVLLTLSLVSIAVLQVTPPPSPVAGATEVTSRASGDWGVTATWSCNCIPTSSNAVKILAGHTVTMSGTRTAAKITVEGTLKASRTATSTLTISGNLIVQGNGVLDYGTSSSPIPSTVTARINWILDEGKYVGGMTEVPLDSDVGLWAIDAGKVLTNGPDRGAWTLLAATAPVGARSIVVDTRYAWGWRAGDEVVIGPSNARAPGETNSTAFQDERRKITAISGSTVTLDAPLTYEHRVQDVAWTDTFGHAFTERLAPPVANLTRNIIFAAANTSHRPHTMFMEQATADIADAAFVAFSPAPRNIGKFSGGRFIPFARYALHFHQQKDASRSSRLDSVLITGGAGRGLTIHDSYGITAYDVVVYDQAKTAFEGGNQAFWFEEAVSSRGAAIPETGANDLWLDRPLALRFGVVGGINAVGISFSAGMGAQIFGAHAAEAIGPLGAGMFWPNPTTCEKGDASCQDPNRGVRGFRLTSHSSTLAFGWWNNAQFPDVVVDLLGWNSAEGIDFGAYTTATKLFQVRLIGNTVAQDMNRVIHRKVTGFLFDGQGRGGVGIHVHKYVFASPEDELYENGVIRGSATAMDFECEVGQSSCGPEPHVQLARVRFEGDPLLSFVWHSARGAYWRIRSQTGLLRNANFTLYRKDQAVTGGVFDAAYEAIRVDGDTAGTVAPPPKVRLTQGGGCVADEAVVLTGSVALCVETDAPTVEFYTGKDLISRVAAAGVAQVTFSMSTFTKKRGYFYAKAIAANGRVNYSRVLRVIREAPTITPELVQAPAQQAATPSTPTAAAARPPRGSTPAGAASAPAGTPRPSGVPTPSPAPRLAAASTSRGSVTSVAGPRLYIVQVAIVPSHAQGVSLSGALKRAGFAPYLVRLGDRFAVRLGAFRQQPLALQLARTATRKGFPAVVIDGR